MNLTWSKNGRQERKIAYEVERHATATAALELTREYLTSAGVRQELGGLATELIEVAYMAEVPDIIHGQVQPLPNYRERDVFPFILARWGEVLSNPMVELTPMQQQTFGMRALELGLEPYSGLEPRAHEQQQMILPECNDSGAWGTLSKWKEHEGLLIAKRPAVCIRPMSLRAMALAAAHELSHTHDTLKAPLSNQPMSDANFESEIKAYPVAYAVDLRTSPEDGRITSALSAKVTRIVQRYNGLPLSDPNAFRATKEIKDSLIAHGHRSIW